MAEKLFDPAAFGRDVKQCAAALGMSVREAAAEADVPPATFNRVQRGRAPDVENYLRLIAWLEANSWRRLALNGEQHDDR